MKNRFLEAILLQRAEEQAHEAKRQPEGAQSSAVARGHKSRATRETDRAIRAAIDVEMKARRAAELEVRRKRIRALLEDDMTAVEVMEATGFGRGQVEHVQREMSAERRRREAEAA